MSIENSEKKKALESALGQIEKQFKIQIKEIYII